MTCLMKIYRSLHYPGITKILFFELEVRGSNPRPAKFNLKLNAGKLFKFAKVAASLLWSSKFLKLVLRFSVLSWVPAFSWVSINHTKIRTQNYVQTQHSNYTSSYWQWKISSKVLHQFSGTKVWRKVLFYACGNLSAHCWRRYKCF